MVLIKTDVLSTTGDWFSAGTISSDDDWKPNLRELIEFYGKAPKKITRAEKTEDQTVLVARSNDAGVEVERTFYSFDTVKDTDDWFTDLETLHLRHVIESCGGMQWTCSEDNFTESFDAANFVEVNNSDETETLIEWLTQLKGLDIGEETTLEWMPLRRVK